jgi:hypothetical protein
MNVAAGTYELEGYVGVTDTKVVFLTINKGSDAEINFILSGKSKDSLLTKDNQKVVAVVKVSNNFMSSVGSAELIQIKKEVARESKVMVYHLPADLKKIK